MMSCCESWKRLVTRTGARVGVEDSHHNQDPQTPSIEAVMSVAESDNRISCRHISPLVASHETEDSFRYYTHRSAVLAGRWSGGAWPTPNLYIGPEAKMNLKIHTHIQFGGLSDECSFYSILRRTDSGEYYNWAPWRAPNNPRRRTPNICSTLWRALLLRRSHLQVQFYGIEMTRETSTDRNHRVQLVRLRFQFPPSPSLPALLPPWKLRSIPPLCESIQTFSSIMSTSPYKILASLSTVPLSPENPNRG